MDRKMDGWIDRGEMDGRIDRQKGLTERLDSCSLLHREVYTGQPH